MMDFDHNTLVAFSKSWGLFYLMGFFLCVVAYVCWPTNRKRFERAKTSILDGDDKPWK
jgi:cytochrome c oxidase cbb3-type subunit IV